MNMLFGKLALLHNSVPSGNASKLLADRPAGGAPRPAGAYTRPAYSKPLDNVPAGILYMTLASFLFAVSSAIAKWQVAIYPVGEVMFLRSFSSLALSSAALRKVPGI